MDNPGAVMNKPRVKCAARRSSAARHAGRHVAIILAILTTLVASSSGAVAATHWTTGGRPGSVQVPTVAGSSTMVGGPTVTLPARYAWRSAATSGPQRVILTATLYRYDRFTGRYLDEQSTWSAVDIASGAPGSWLPALTIKPRNFGDYTVDFAVGWYAGTGPTLLGSTYIAMNHARDYVCWINNPYYCAVNRVVGGRGSIWLAL
jgi:hypothetical protein